MSLSLMNREPGSDARTRLHFLKRLLPNPTRHFAVVLPVVGLLGVLLTVRSSDVSKAYAIQQNVQADAPDPWVGVNRPFHLFDMQTQLFGPSPTSYEARRNEKGGGREDTMTFNTFDGTNPWLALSIYRVRSEGLKAEPFFVTTARTAARAGLAVIRSDQPGVEPIRFGDLQLANVSLAGRGAPKSCFGFRLIADRSLMRFSGLACGSAEHPLDAALLACTLERIDLLSAGDDHEIARYFASAEIRRGVGCQKPRTVATADATAAIDPPSGGAAAGVTSPSAHRHTTAHRKPHGHRRGRRR